MKVATVVGLSLFGLSLSSCRSDRDGALVGDLEQRRSELDVVTGSVAGQILWNGASLTPAEADPLLARGDAINQVLHSSSYQFQNVPAGDRTLALYSSLCSDPTTILGEVAFTVTAGSTTAVNMDLTATAGRVSGSIRVNGSPPLNAVLRIRSGLESCNGYSDAVSLPPGGSFSRVLTPRAYMADVVGGAGVLGTFAFSVAAGATTDLGTIDLTTGGAQLGISWNGSPILAQEASLLYVWGGPVRQSVETSTVDLRDLAPGSHAVGLFANSPLAQYNNCVGDSAAKLGETSFVISAGSIASALFDLTATAGRVTGSVAVNGVPVANASLDIRVGGVPCFNDTAGADGGGVFSRLLPPNSYVADIHGPLGIIGSVSFATTAGTTTGFGQRNIQAGSVQGNITWNNVPVSVGEASELYVFESGAFSQALNEPSYALATVAAGTHTLGLYNTHVPAYDRRCVGDPAQRIGAMNVSVTAGSTTGADFDLTSTAGRAAGSILVNGAPLAGARLELLPVGGTGCGGDMTFTDASGSFSRLLAPQSYNGYLWVDAGFLASFSFTVVAAQTTDIDSVTTPACSPTSTPSCSELPTEIGGGLDAVNGLELTFSTVDVGGNTTVVESGFGPAPPTGFQIMGGRYWDIDTTAGYSGPINVCIHYDPAEVTGSEDALGLVHDDGSGWMAITTFVCKSDGCLANSSPCEPCSPQATICGFATSLSPFAIVEPASAPDATPPVFANVPGTVTAYATSTAGAAASYDAPTAIDDVDGATPVSCTPASGSQFPSGKTTVTCTTADTSGNPNATSFVVWVQYEAPADGSFFLKPIRPDGSSVFRIGRPVPVKFRLTGASAGITNLAAKLVVTKISDQIRGTADDVSDEDGDEIDFLFKYRKAKGIYAYRWNTCDQTRGTFRLRADLGDQVVHEINVSLRKAN